MQPGHVWVDGQVLPADATHLSVFDRGFQLGDGVFETLRARSGRVTELHDHATRLRGSAEGLGIALPDDVEAALERGIADLLTAEGLDGPDGDASIRITVSRGAFHGRGLLPIGEDVPPTVAIQVWPVTPPPAGHLEMACTSCRRRCAETRRTRWRCSRRTSRPTTSSPARGARPAPTTRCS
jgi:branched-chain amino acid aminotransferase